ncbi:MAG TPA: nucleotidyl transferase [Microscillaceae bacterium]|jgi:NDP-sugar pyrophosphorylase family protein|nr:nucleotidyl transferase [Microscillaceae bacterium]
MKPIRHALIMAAGRGTRMLPLTDQIPKPMAPFKGSTLIADGIQKIKPVLDFVHITVGYKGAVLAQHVIELGVQSVFNTEGKGNAWWIYNTLLRHLDEAIFVLTADNVTDLDFDLLEQEYYKYNAPACMVVPVLPVPGLEGDYIHHTENCVFELNRQKPAPTYCSGIQILNPYRINQITEATEDFNVLWRQLIEKKQLYCSDSYPKKWFTVDTVEQLDRLNKGKI